MGPNLKRLTVYLVPVAKKGAEEVQMKYCLTLSANPDYGASYNILPCYDHEREDRGSGVIERVRTR